MLVTEASKPCFEGTEHNEQTTTTSVEHRLISISLQMQPSLGKIIKFSKTQIWCGSFEHTDHILSCSVAIELGDIVAFASFYKL